jgi:hypothetical protein
MVAKYEEPQSNSGNCQPQLDAAAMALALLVVFRLFCWPTLEAGGGWCIGGDSCLIALHSTRLLPIPGSPVGRFGSQCGGEAAERQSAGGGGGQAGGPADRGERQPAPGAGGPALGARVLGEPATAYQAHPQDRGKGPGRERFQGWDAEFAPLF